MTDSRKIKLLFRHRSMEMGGVEKVMLSLLNNLDREKFDMTVLLNLNQGELRNEIPAHVRKVYLTDGKEDMSKNRILQKVQLLQRKSSYVFYLIHKGFLAMLIYNSIAPNVITIFILLNLASILLFKYVEEPLNNWIRKKYG